jgi:hypothetical protein
MGNHPSKERPPLNFQGSSNIPNSHVDRSVSSPYPTSSNGPSSAERPSESRRRSSRPDLSIFGIQPRPDADPASPEARKETKAEREARRLERERALREKERERSVREEGVDGGYMVTLGVYTGTEDFCKPIVRQLMVCLP